MSTVVVERHRKRQHSPSPTPRKRRATSINDVAGSQERPRQRAEHRAISAKSIASQADGGEASKQSQDDSDSDWEPVTPPLPAAHLTLDPRDASPQASRAGSLSDHERSLSPAGDDSLRPIDRPGDESSPVPTTDVPKRSIFDIHDEEEDQAILAQLQELLPASEDDFDGSADEDEDYEARRERRLEKNREMLLQLGFTGSAAAPPVESGLSGSFASSWPLDQQSSSSDEQTFDQQIPSSSTDTKSRNSRKSSKKTVSEKRQERRERQNRRTTSRRALKLAEDGTTTSLPLEGTSHTLAYIYLLPRRARDHYVYIEDCPVAAPKPPTPSPEPEPSSTEIKPSRRATVLQKKKASSYRPYRGLPSANGGPEKGEDSPSTCHQCRRKRAEALMHCRNCPLLWCYTCMDFRYGAYDPNDPEDESYDGCEDIWDPGETDWLCPKCRGICNCSLCLIKGGLKHHLPTPGPQGKRMGALSSTLRKAKAEREFRSARQVLQDKGVFMTGVPAKGPVKRPLSAKEKRDAARKRFVEIKDRIKVVKAELAEALTLREQRSSVPDKVDSESLKGTRRKRAPSTDLSSVSPSDAEEEEELPGVGPTAAAPAKAEIKRIRLRLKRKSPARLARQVPPAAQRSRIARRAVKAAKKAQETHVWVKGAADLDHSDSSLSDYEGRASAGATTGPLQGGMLFPSARIAPSEADSALSSDLSDAPTLSEHLEGANQLAVDSFLPCEPQVLPSSPPLFSGDRTVRIHELPPVVPMPIQSYAAFAHEVPSFPYVQQTVSSPSPFRAPLGLQEPSDLHGTQNEQGPARQLAPDGDSVISLGPLPALAMTNGWSSSPHPFGHAAGGMHRASFSLAHHLRRQESEAQLWRRPSTASGERFDERDHYQPGEDSANRNTGAAFGPSANGFVAGHADQSGQEFIAKYLHEDAESVALSQPHRNEGEGLATTIRPLNMAGRAVAHGHGSIADEWEEEQDELSSSPGA
ncbi:unnamed protein product [Parajaminaea phylloscopi]